MDRITRDGFESACGTDRVMATVWLFAAAVGNEGFAGYYSGKKGDLAFFTPTALRTIFAHKTASLAEDANSVFGADGPPQDQTTRRERLRLLPESTRARLADLDNRYFECDEGVDELMENFLSRYPNSLTSKGGAP